MHFDSRQGITISEDHRGCRLASAARTALRVPGGEGAGRLKDHSRGTDHPRELQQITASGAGTELGSSLVRVEQAQGGRTPG